MRGWQVKSFLISFIRQKIAFRAPERGTWLGSRALYGRLRQVNSEPKATSIIPILATFLCPEWARDPSLGRSEALPWVS